MAGRNGTLPMQSGGRRWYRDMKCQQLQLVVTPAGAYFYRVSYEGGRRHRKKISSTLELSLAEARRSCEAMRGGNGGRRHRAAANEKTAGEVFKLMMDDMQAGRWAANGKLKKLAPRTTENRWHCWRPHVEKFGHDQLTLTQFAKTVRPTFDSLREKPGAGNTYRVIVKGLFQYAAEHNMWDGDSPLVDSRTGKKLLPPYPAVKRRRFLTLDQVGLMFAAADQEKNPVWGDFWRLAVLCGARMSNMVAMRWQDVDLANATWSLSHTKTEDYTIALQPDAVAILKRRRKERASDCPYVFPSIDNPLDHMKQWRDSWSRMKEAVPEIADTRPHDVRRTCGSLMTIAGVPLPTVAQQLGHTEGSTATSIYARLNLKAQREAANILGAAIKKVDDRSGKR